MMSSDATFPVNPAPNQQETADPNLPNVFSPTTPNITAQQQEEIETPRDTDVLCGRTRIAVRHPGNQTYRRLVTLNKGFYAICVRSEKLKISKGIVAAIREQDGRFLEENPNTHKWFDIGDKKAVEKTSQALREKQPETLQKIQELGGGAAGAQALLEKQLAEERLLQEQTCLSTTGGVLLTTSGMGSGQSPANFGDTNFESMDPETLAEAAGFPPADIQRRSSRFLQPMSDDLSQLPHERQLSASDLYAGEQLDAPPPLGPITTRDVSMELMKLSLANTGEQLEAPPPLGPITTRDVSMELLKLSLSEQPIGQDKKPPAFTQEEVPAPKGAAVREQTSPMSFMSDFSNYGEMVMNLDDDANKRIDSLVREFGTNPTSSLSPKDSLQPPAPSVDRRKQFAARVKAERCPPSELSDGMPHIHPIESTHSLFSNMSLMGEEDARGTTNSSFMAGDLIIGSRRGEKMGNVSTRGIPMDDLSFLSNRSK